MDRILPLTFTIALLF